MVYAPNVFGPIARPTTATTPNSMLLDESRFLLPGEWVFDTPPQPTRQPALGPEVWRARMAIRPYRQCASADPVADVPTGAVVAGQDTDEDHPPPVRDLAAAFDAVL